LNFADYCILERKIIQAKWKLYFQKLSIVLIFGWVWGWYCLINLIGDKFCGRKSFKKLFWKSERKNSFCWQKNYLNIRLKVILLECSNHSKDFSFKTSSVKVFEAFEVFGLWSSLKRKNNQYWSKKKILFLFEPKNL